MSKRPYLTLIAGGLLALALDGSAAPLLPANHLGSFIWISQDPAHGGFSAIDLSADGTEFTALTDRGSWTSGRISRDADGMITAMQAQPLRALQDPKGRAFAQKRNDSEGLALAPDGDIYVSFEGPARVFRYTRLDRPPRGLPPEKSFRSLQRNSALEALAIDAAGTLYTLPERSGAMDRPFPVYRFRAGKWRAPFSLPRRGDHLPVGADFGPDGRFYLLEREFHGIAGFSSRIRSFAVTPQGFTDERQELLSRTGQHGNLEGLAVWRDGQNRIRLTMIADDNFAFFLTTQIVEYAASP